MIEAGKEMQQKVSCAEMLADLTDQWQASHDGHRAYLMSRMVEAGCREVGPFLLRHIECADPFYRGQALFGLSKLKLREYRDLFLRIYHEDPSAEVRQKALIEVGDLFRGERDKEILKCALTAFDDPTSELTMRLTAGAVMMYQLGISHDEQGGPAWWKEEEDDLQHPSI